MKKNLPLIFVLSLCGIGFLAGSVFAAKAFSDKNDKDAAIVKNERTLRGLLKRKTLALSEENLEQGTATCDALKKAVTMRIGVLMQPKRLETFFDGDATQFMSLLTERNRTWIRLCEEKNVDVANTIRGFGFSRYLQNNETAPADKLKALDVEAAVTGEVIKLLADARDDYETELKKANVLTPSETTYLKIASVVREGVELDEAQRRSLQRDELVVKPVESAEKIGLCQLTDGMGKEIRYESLRRADVVNAVTLRVQFVSDSGVLRNFMQSLVEYPIYVRDISASRAPADMLPQAKTPADTPAASAPASNPFALFGAAVSADTTAQPAVASVPARRVVVENVPELFTVTLEYITPVVPQKPAKEEAK